MKIVLIGYMGSGKTTVGKLLSENLKYQFQDLDLQIESEIGHSISEIFSKKGEIYFRKKENEILKKILKSNQNTVVATGGGTPCYSDTLPFLLAQSSVCVIYLKASIEVLTKRLFPERKQRPLIAHLSTETELFDFIRKHLFERSYYYSQAHKVITIDSLSAIKISEKIKKELF